VNRESRDCLKNEHSEADAKEVVSNANLLLPWVLGMSTKGVGMQSGSHYSQPAQHGYAAASSGYPGASTGYKGYQNKGSNQYQQHPATTVTQNHSC